MYFAHSFSPAKLWAHRLIVNRFRCSAGWHLQPDEQYFWWLTNSNRHQSPVVWTRTQAHCPPLVSASRDWTRCETFVINFPLGQRRFVVPLKRINPRRHKSCIRSTFHSSHDDDSQNNGKMNRKQLPVLLDANHSQSQFSKMICVIVMRTAMPLMCRRWPECVDANNNLNYFAWTILTKYSFDIIERVMPRNPGRWTVTEATCLLSTCRARDFHLENWLKFHSI